jgi:hypothetical protein
MKRHYIQPLVHSRALTPADTLAAVSGQNGGVTIIEGGDEGGDPGGALGKQTDIWDDDSEDPEDDTYSPFIH